MPGRGIRTSSPRLQRVYYGRVEVGPLVGAPHHPRGTRKPRGQYRFPCASFDEAKAGLPPRRPGPSVVCRSARRSPRLSSRRTFFESLLLLSFVSLLVAGPTTRLELHLPAPKKPPDALGVGLADAPLPEEPMGLGHGRWRSPRPPSWPLRALRTLPR